MFNEHQSRIGSYARQSPEQMARVYAFVLATVQQSLWQTPEIMASIDAEGIDSRFLWGFKGPAYEFIEAEYEGVYETAMAIYLGYANPDVVGYELVRYFAGLPGLGVVKGGFMAQLCFGVAGCMDTHNMTMYGINPNQFKAHIFKNGSVKRRRRMLREYFTLIDSEGGCAALWDRWCEYVAERNPERYTGAYEVSELHVKAIIGEDYGRS